MNHIRSKTDLDEINEFADAFNQMKDAIPSSHYSVRTKLELALAKVLDAAKQRSEEFDQVQSALKDLQHETKLIQFDLQSTTEEKRAAQAQLDDNQLE